MEKKDLYARSVSNKYAVCVQRNNILNPFSFCFVLFSFVSALLSLLQA